MRTGRRVAAVCAVVCVQAGLAYGQPRSMTLTDVLTLARDQAPRIVSARLALAEARGRLAGASLRFQSNPELDVSLGNRAGPGARYTDLEVGLGQRFEPASRRAARIEGANAAIARGAATLDEVTREAMWLATS